MTVTQRLMKPGRFHVEMIDSFPDSVAGQVSHFDHIVITPTQVDTDALTDASILTQAAYTGVVTSKPSLRIFEGADLSWWLGTDQGLGQIYTAPTGIVASSLSATMAVLLGVAPITAGSFNNTGTGALTTSFCWVTKREAIDSACRSFGAEWRVNPNATLDAAIRTLLFKTVSATGGVVVTRKAEGIDGPLQGVDGSLLVPSSDIEQYTSQVLALGAGTFPTFDVATNGAASPFKDFNNGTVVMQRLVSSPTDPTTPLAATAAAVYNLYNSIRREIKLSSDTYSVGRFVKPGDETWVYDLRAGLFDTANQIEYRGELIAPVKLRVYALTWPVERGMGVYLRKSGATPTYVDLTPYVAWEDADVQWEVGSADRAAVGDGISAGVATLPATSPIQDRVANSLVVAFTPVRRGNGTADTPGTGATQSGRYQITDGKCFFSIFFKFGTAGAVANAGVTTFDAPVPFGAGNDAFQAVGSGVGVQAGLAFNFQVIRNNANDRFELYSPGQVTAAAPGAVTFSDAWRFDGWYWV